MRRIVLDNSEDTCSDYLRWQMNYMDLRTGLLIPNTEVWVDNELYLRINALGCKGDDVVANKAVIGFFGDSTVFGIGRRSWTDYVQISGFQSLNGGVEGYSIARAADNFHRLRDAVEFSAVVVCAGWNGLLDKSDEKDWLLAMKRFEGPHLLAVCTLASCLTEECVARGLDELIACKQKGRQFTFWCAEVPTRDHISFVYRRILQFNSFVKHYCEDHGAVLVDMHPHFVPAKYQDIPNDFIDILHPRPAAQSRMGRIATGYLEERLLSRIKPKTPSVWDKARQFLGQTTGGENSRRDEQPPIYPVW